MAEESGQERTIEPSAKRLADARSKGNVARSRYLSHGLMLGAAAALLFALGASLRDAATQWLVHGLTFDAAAAANPAAMGDRLMRAVMAAMTSLVPVFAVLCVAAAIGPVAMGGLMFNLDVVAPDAERLNPMTGFGRLFSANGMIELGKAIVVVAVLGSVAVSLVRSRIERFAALASSSSLPAALGEAGDLLLTAIAAMVGVVALLAAIEAPLQWWRYRKQLMMTPEEAKREAKDAEGDPRIKGRIRNAMRAMARKRMMAAVPKADVVVTNPQHFAVALKYLEPRRSSSPRGTMRWPRRSRRWRASTACRASRRRRSPARCTGTRKSTNPFPPRSTPRSPRSSPTCTSCAATRRAPGRGRSSRATSRCRTAWTRCSRAPPPEP